MVYSLALLLFPLSLSPSFLFCRGKTRSAERRGLVTHEVRFTLIYWAKVLLSSINPMTSILIVSLVGVRSSFNRANTRYVCIQGDENLMNLISSSCSSSYTPGSETIELLGLNVNSCDCEFEFRGLLPLPLFDLGWSIGRCTILLCSWYYRYTMEWYTSWYSILVM